MWLVLWVWLIKIRIKLEDLSSSFQSSLLGFFEVQKKFKWKKHCIRLQFATVANGLEERFLLHACLCTPLQKYKYNESRIQMQTQIQI